MDEGRVREDGPPEEVLAHYLGHPIDAVEKLDFEGKVFVPAGEDLSGFAPADPPDDGDRDLTLPSPSGQHSEVTEGAANARVHGEAEGAGRAS
jgi:hypothetical protein